MHFLMAVLVNPKAKDIAAEVAKRLEPFYQEASEPGKFGKWDGYEIIDKNVKLTRKGAPYCVLTPDKNWLSMDDGMSEKKYQRRWERIFDRYGHYRIVCVDCHI